MKKTFQCRDDLINYVASIAPWAKGNASSIFGGSKAAMARLLQVDPVAYSRSRNDGDGAVSQLSPYIHHGILTLSQVRDHALRQVAAPEQAMRFIQELAWRDYWQRQAILHPEWLWQDVESYKTGFDAQDYAQSLPQDIRTGETDVACINALIHQLLNQGYVHNHGRMYIASYVVHFRRVRWQAGARWFLEHLLDGDEASNNFSWQWVASTFSHQPYIFNLANVSRYFGSQLDTDPVHNQILDASYEELARKLFPNLGESHG